MLACLLVTKLSERCFGFAPRFTTLLFAARAMTVCNKPVINQQRAVVPQAAATEEEEGSRLGERNSTVVHTVGSPGQVK